MSSKVQVDVLHDELASVTGGHVVDAEHGSPLARELRVFPVLAGPEHVALNLVRSGASHLVVGREQPEIGHGSCALLLDERTPWGEGAAGRPASGCGCRSADSDELAPTGEVGDGGDQLLRIWVRGRAKQVAGGAGLHHPARVRGPEPARPRAPPRPVLTLIQRPDAAG